MGGLGSVRGKVAVITGAAGGIGAATARAFAAAGARVVLVDVQAAALERVRAALPGARAWAVDVSDPAGVRGLAAEVEAACGGADVLINNAGLTVIGDFLAHTEADWSRVMGVNLGGVVNGCRSFLPQLRARGGWIVNISSIFGIVGVPGQTAYCASKFAVRGFSEALREELRADGDRVGLTLVHPGGVRTGIIEGARVASGAPEAVRSLADFFATRAVPPERVAARLLHAVERGHRRLLVCPESFAFDWLRRLAPEVGNRIAVEAMVRGMGLPVGSLTPER